MTILQEKTENIRSNSINTDEDPAERVKIQVGDKLKNCTEFELKPINRPTVRKLIKKGKGNKASGYDNIDGESLKIAAPLIKDSLIHLTNLSILTSEFACQWKHLNVHPRHKQVILKKKKTRDPYHKSRRLAR